MYENREVIESKLCDALEQEGISAECRKKVELGRMHQRVDFYITCPEKWVYMLIVDPMVARSRKASNHIKNFIKRSKKFSELVHVERVTSKFALENTIRLVDNIRKFINQIPGAKHHRLKTSPGKFVPKVILRKSHERA